MSEITQEQIALVKERASWPASGEEDWQLREALRALLAAYDEQKRLAEAKDKRYEEWCEQRETENEKVLAEACRRAETADTLTLGRAEAAEKLAEERAKAERFVRMLVAKDTHPGTDDYEEMVGSPEFWTTEYAHAMNKLGEVMELVERAHAAEKLAEERGREIERLKAQMLEEFGRVLANAPDEHGVRGDGMLACYARVPVDFYEKSKANEAKVAELEREKDAEFQRGYDHGIKQRADELAANRRLLQAEQAAHEQTRFALERSLAVQRLLGVLTPRARHSKGRACEPADEKGGGE